MKTLFTLCIAMLACSQLWAQHRIALNDGSVIENVRIHDIKGTAVIYEKAKSLHDIHKHMVNFIKTDTAIIAFNKDGQAVYTYGNFKENRSSNVQRDRRDHSFIFFATPTAIFDEMNTAQGGIEWRTFKHWSLVVEAGSIVDSWRNWGLGVPVDMEGWVARGGLRWYDNVPFDLFRINGYFFLEGETYVKQAKATNQLFDSFEWTPESIYSSILMAGLNGKMGLQRVYNSGFMLEAWIGGGLQALVHDEHKLDLERKSYYTSQVIEPRYTITAGIKVGIAL